MSRRPREPGLALQRPFPASPCPHCGELQDASSSTDPTHPNVEPGDIGICANCCGLMVLDAELRRIAIDADDPRIEEATRGAIRNAVEIVRRDRLRQGIGSA